MVLQELEEGHKADRTAHRMTQLFPILNGARQDQNDIPLVEALQKAPSSSRQELLSH
jgi:hypothetical protein